jgi:hypothetical protein
MAGLTPTPASAASRIRAHRAPASWPPYKHRGPAVAICSGSRTLPHSWGTSEWGCVQCLPHSAARQLSRSGIDHIHWAPAQQFISICLAAATSPCCGDGCCLIPASGGRTAATLGRHSAGIWGSCLASVALGNCLAVTRPPSLQHRLHPLHNRCRLNRGSVGRCMAQCQASSHS